MTITINYFLLPLRYFCSPKACTAKRLIELSDVLRPFRTTRRDILQETVVLDGPVLSHAEISDQLTRLRPPIMISANLAAPGILSGP